jgi:hypothetical protein
MAVWRCWSALTGGHFALMNSLIGSLEHPVSIAAAQATPSANSLNFSVMASF